MTTTSKQSSREPDPNRPPVTSRKPLAPVSMSRTTSSTTGRATPVPPSPYAQTPVTPRLPNPRTSSNSSTLSSANANTRSPRPAISTRKLKDQYGASSSTLEPPITPGRLPRADIQARVAGGSSISGRASPAIGGGRDGGSTVGSVRTAPSSPMFFHASSIKQQPKAPRATPSAVNLNNKFFHANNVQPPPRTSTPGPTLAPPRPTSSHPRDSYSGSNHPRDNASNHPRDTASNHPRDNLSNHPRDILTSNISTKPLQIPGLSDREPRSVRFVYANGAVADETLSLSTKAPSELSSNSSSNTFSGSPSSYGPRPGLSSHGSSLGPSAMSPPLSPPSSVSRRSSIESKNRHNRAVSVGSIQDVYTSSPNTVAQMGQTQVPHAPPQQARPTFAQREEAAALARRERKVLDLEISNASLLAINKTLEKKMRKQLGELRRFRRLSRSGKLSSLTPSSPQPHNSNRDSIDTVIPDPLSDLDEDDSPSSDSYDSASEDEEDEDDAAAEKEPVKHRVTDEKRLASDLRKHQALLDASIQMNQSLRRCSLLTEQLITEGKRQLEYMVPDSEVRVGGRVLREEGAEEEEEEEEEGGVGIDVDGGEGRAEFHFGGGSSSSEDEDEEDETGEDDTGEGEEVGEDSFVASSLDGLSEEDSSFLESSELDSEDDDDDDEDGQMR